MKYNAEFFGNLKMLIERWCDRRAFGPLARALPPYVAFNGMTDGWAGILDALEGVRAFNKDNLTEEEVAALADLIRAAEKAVFDR